MNKCVIGLLLVLATIVAGEENNIGDPPKFAENTLSKFHKYSTPNPLPATLMFESKPSDKELAKLQVAIATVLEAARVYAEMEKLEYGPDVLPERIVFCDSAAFLSKLTGQRLYHKSKGSIFIGWCFSKESNVFVVGNSNLRVLGHELGHWFFGESESRADRFRDFWLKRMENK